MQRAPPQASKDGAQQAWTGAKMRRLRDELGCTCAWKADPLWVRARASPGCLSVAVLESGRDEVEGSVGPGEACAERCSSGVAPKPLTFLFPERPTNASRPAGSGPGEKCRLCQVACLAVSRRIFVSSRVHHWARHDTTLLLIRADRESDRHWDSLVPLIRSGTTTTEQGFFLVRLSIVQALQLRRTAVSGGRQCRVRSTY